MLERTFVHIPGVGSTTEKLLWRQGCLSWHHLLSNLDKYSVGSADPKVVRATLEKSISALEKKEHQFFARRLNPRDAWRAFPAFRDNCVYLDIETDGGNSPASITTIGLYDGKEFRCLIKGQDLGNFPDIISNYSMIVTFFGTGFDIPVLQKAFKTTKLDQIHVDLCPVLRRLGVRGGLKKIEMGLGIERDPRTVGLNGLDAIKLWRKYQVLGDENALATLIAYNREDVVNLEKLADYTFGKMEWVTTRKEPEPEPEEEEPPPSPVKPKAPALTYPRLR